MISLAKTIIIGIICFVAGELCGIFITALLSANKRFEEKYDEAQQRRKEVADRSN